MGEVIVITSGKGGVGKTTTTANDGKCRSSQGPLRVVLLQDRTEINPGDLEEIERSS